MTAQNLLREETPMEAGLCHPGCFSSRLHRRTLLGGLAMTIALRSTAIAAASAAVSQHHEIRIQAKLRSPMTSFETTLTLIGGPTVLIELAGFRLLTDPTFDAPGRYQRAVVIQEKTTGPALAPEAIGAIDAVLLSHDQHIDNLDQSGRAFLPRAGRVFTSPVGAERLGQAVQGLAPWESVRLDAADGRSLHVTATPARHGPPGIEGAMGEVAGFVLGLEVPGDAIYITGDTVWYEGVAEVAKRFRPRLVILFAGAARPRGPFHITMDNNDALETAFAFPQARIVGVHNNGWRHYTESQADLIQAFTTLGLVSRLQPLEPGQPVRLTL
jgi:L-ascorbate metabolism protein UlaG (beta-lactamase superfamily)